jgi:hypothetical protein
MIALFFELCTGDIILHLLHLGIGNSCIEFVQLMPISYISSPYWYIPHKQQRGQLLLLVTYLAWCWCVFCAQFDFGNVVGCVTAVICNEERTDYTAEVASSWNVHQEHKRWTVIIGQPPDHWPLLCFCGIC